MNMSDRVCQFFLRGRCQRENCEFKHEKPEKSSDMKDPEKEKEATPPQEADVTTNDTLFDGSNLEWVR